MNYDAILVFPKIDFFSTIQYPTGLYKIAYYCKSQYNILILDERLENIEEKINFFLNQKHKLLCIGFSVMTGSQIKYALSISKKFHEKIPIVWGGMHPSICPESTINNSYIDFTIRGDGEDAFLNLLHFLSNKQAFKKLFASKLDKDSTLNQFNGFKLSNKYIDFNAYPIKNEYFVARDGFNKSFTLETSRGCPYNCSFCHNSMTKKYLFMDSQVVIQSIYALFLKYQIDGIIFQEDDFFANIQRIIKILNFLKLIKIGWKANCRIDYVKKLLKNGTFILIQNSNCKVLQFGAESGSDRILSLLNKKFTVNDTIEANRILSNFSIKIRYNFIVGFPTETFADMKNTFVLIKKLRAENKNVEIPFINVYTPYPGTPMYDMAVKNGFTQPKKLEDWIAFNWNQVNMPWLTEKETKFIVKISNYCRTHNNYNKKDK